MPNPRRRFKDSVKTSTGLYPMASFVFETVTVNEQGTVIRTQSHQARRSVESLPNGVTLPLVAIPAGRFLMGSRAGEGYEAGVVSSDQPRR